MKVRLIINTAAVRGSARRVVERLLREQSPAAEIAHTVQQGDVLRLAAKAIADGVDRVVIAGGDGSVHEAATAIAGTNVELAIVPGGSGNDFVKTARIPTDPAAAIELAVHGRARAIDTADLTCTDSSGQQVQRVFVNIAEVGLGGRVVRLAQSLRLLVGRKTGYRAGVAAALIAHRWYRIQLTIDGSPRGSYLTTNLIVANGQYFGAGMRPMPGALLDDGVLDVALIGEMSRAAVVANSAALKTGLPASHPQIHHWRGREIGAASTERVPVEADGELLGFLPATFRVRPSSLRIVAPSARKPASP